MNRIVCLRVSKKLKEKREKKKDFFLMRLSYKMELNDDQLFSLPFHNHLKLNRKDSI